MLCFVAIEEKVNHLAIIYKFNFIVCHEGSHSLEHHTQHKHTCINKHDRTTMQYTFYDIHKKELNSDKRQLQLSKQFHIATVLTTSHTMELTILPGLIKDVMPV